VKLSAGIGKAFLGDLLAKGLHLVGFRPAVLRVAIGLADAVGHAALQLRTAVVPLVVAQVVVVFQELAKLACFLLLKQQGIAAIG
jgi:hypothetical protein